MGFLHPKGAALLSTNSNSNNSRVFSLASQCRELSKDE